MVSRKFDVVTFECCLTTELSGRPQPPLRIGEHAIHCEHDAPTIFHGPLQRVVRRHCSPTLLTASISIQRKTLRRSTPRKNITTSHTHTSALHSLTNLTLP